MQQENKIILKIGMISLYVYKTQIISDSCILSILLSDVTLPVLCFFLFFSILTLHSQSQFELQSLKLEV